MQWESQITQILVLVASSSSFPDEELQEPAETVK